MYVVLPLYFRVRNGKLTFYSVTDKSYREREIKSVLHVCVCMCVYRGRRLPWDSMSSIELQEEAYYLQPWFKRGSQVCHMCWL